MEGVKCTFIDCNCHDFLPFTCPLCNEAFCLQHRSRFSHNPCAVTNLTLPKEMFSDDVIAQNILAAKEAKSLLNSVEGRFENTSTPIAATHSLNIATAAIPENILPSQKTSATLDKLKNIETKSSSSTERSISSKTRMILIKSNSIGNSSIPAVDRIYFSGRFLAMKNIPSDGGEKSAGDMVNFFYRRSMTLGEMLHQLGMTFPQLSHGTAVAPTGQSLILSTEDTPEWRLWDRSKPLELLLESFEEVVIGTAPTSEVVSAQKVLEVQRTEQYETALAVAQAAILAARLAANVGNDDELVTYPLSVGEVVEYYPSSGSSSSRDGAGAAGMELVQVVGAHQDDFPNIYYTIRFNATKREKQTDRFHLRRRPGALSARLGAGGATVTEVEGGVCGAPMTLKINHGGKVIDLVPGLIGDRNSVDGLKGIIYQYTGILPKSQKLVYKGVVLKDGEVDLKTAKLANGSKVTLIGSVSK